MTVNNSQALNQTRIILQETKERVLDVLRAELDADERWSSAERTISAAFTRVLECPERAVERFNDCRALVLDYAEGRLGKDEGWPILRRRLLRLLSDQRDAGLAVTQFIGFGSRVLGIEATEGNGHGYGRDYGYDF